MISTRIRNKLHLYRRSWLTASVFLLVVCCALALAASYQRRSPHKLRATALLELTTDASGAVTSRIIPITILDNGRFHDASIYQSHPRPVALDNGVVYEAQKSGVPVGYVTIYAGEKNQASWMAMGKWQPVVQAAAAPATPPVSPQAGDDRPILHRGGNQPASTSTSPQPSGGSNNGSDDRPVLHRNDGPPPSAPPQPPPAMAMQADSQSGGQDDPNRPVLRRRQPGAETAPPPATSTPPPSENTPPSTTPPRSAPPRPVVTATPGTQKLAAVSDAQSSDTRSFDYQWRPGEQQQIEAKVRKLALAQLPNETAQANEHALTNVMIRSFDLDLSNAAVVVLQAEVPGGYLARGNKTAPGKFVSRYITLIARMDIEGNPQRLAVSVTDSSQLDVAPRLNLVDAVDVDGDGLAELLFEEYGVDQKSFIVYGVGHGSVTKVFEGASQSLR